MRIRDLLDKRSVCLDAAPQDKASAITELVNIMARSGCINDVDKYRQAVFDRESQSSTGFGEGIALPHAKSDAVDRPGLAAMVVPKGVEFEAFDDEPVFLFFMIASPLKASDAHLDVLARISTLMMKGDFRDNLLKAKNVEEFLDVIDNAEAEVEAKERAENEESQNSADESANSNEASESDDSANTADENASASESEEINTVSNEEIKKDGVGVTKKAKAYDIVAVTACPAGLSHTYMAAEALEQKAKELGISIKVEADGAAGNRNTILPEEIALAKAVIVAADRAIDIDRFVGKRMVRTGVVDGVHRPAELIKKALDPKCPVYQTGAQNESSNVLMKMYRHLMSGLTYILPLAATAGILSAFSRLDFVSTTSLGLFLDTISYSIGTLLFPVLSAFIAFSMAGRMALVAGFTGGVMADMAGAGVIGALVNGFVGGSVAFCIAKLAQRFLKGHDAMFALLVYPLAGAIFTTLIAQFVTNIPTALVDNFINNFINDADTLTLVIIGAVLAGMMSADMGGPFNKVSYATGVLLLADCLPEQGAGSLVMSSVMLGGMIPPIAAGVAARFIAPERFSQKERDLSYGAIFKGLLFITEGVIPYLAAAKRLRIACVLGSASAGAISMYFRCGVVAPHGGVFIIPLAINPLYYIVALVGGTLVGALFFVLLHPVDAETKALRKQRKAIKAEAKASAKAAAKAQKAAAATSAAATSATSAVVVDGAANADANAAAPNAAVGAAESTVGATEATASAQAAPDTPPSLLGGHVIDNNAPHEDTNIKDNLPPDTSNIPVDCVSQASNDEGLGISADTFVEKK